ncbi:hypothetical protein ABW19_dt0205341 [Dactylella cylindrospora]|nr:hypothetical protein ABW19_dt0205341 [Dactylella cylindrospora]
MPCNPAVRLENEERSEGRLMEESPAPSVKVEKSRDFGKISPDDALRSWMMGENNRGRSRLEGSRVLQWLSCVVEMSLDARDWIHFAWLQNAAQHPYIQHIDLV